MIFLILFSLIGIMANMEKNINKRLVGVILGTTLLSVNTRSQTPKGKKFFRRVLDFLKGGLKEMKKDIEE